KVSLILAPLVASSGVRVPMMSGRSLGHTGGTLDKLESIPGYRTALSPSEFIQGLAEIGYSMTGQSERVVPADRMLYALRDVTATVESIPLITASILSKKFAEGAEGLVFDVKSGSGAFMKTRKAAEDLAESLVRAGKSLGKKVAAVITDMDQPLGRYVGNFLEVKEAADCLQGRGPVDLMEVTLRLAARMLIMGGVCGQIAEAEEKCLEHISCGAAWDRFIKNVEFQGGDVSVVLNPDRGPKAAIISPYVSSVSGYVRRIDAFKIGMAATVLGAGRMNKDEAVLPAVGIELEKKQGDAVKPEEVLSLIHAETQESLEIALEYLSGAYQFSRTPVSVHSLILDELGS
ncbi:MAG TPA: thymidine phosphorylase, partial [Spirochaetia bacterium]|nr:thymidine phosphorylase [Spirochaetia bacterium]